MVKCYTYSSSCPDPALRFHIEHTVQYTEPDRSTRVHTHDFAELVLVRHGRGAHVVEGDAYELAEGDVFVISPGQSHCYRELDQTYMCNIMYDPAMYLPGDAEIKALPGYYALFLLEPLLRHEHGFRSRLHLSRKEMLAAYDLIRPLEEEYLTRQAGFELLIRSYFSVLIIYLSRQFTVRETAASRELHALSRVVAHIEQHYPDAIRLQALADIACMSQNSLLRFFNHCYGTTPIEFLNRVRLQKAAGLLANTHQTITDIALSVGFSDSNYFSRKFRQHFGVSPRDYRSQR